MSTLRKNVDISGYDWVTISLYLLLMLIGWTMIFASEYNPDTFKGIANINKNYGRQLVWIGVGLVLFLIVQLVEGKIFQNLAFIFLGFVILLLIAVLFTTPINGSTAWFDFGWFRFQPSEFGKTATALALAALLSTPDIKMNNTMGRAQALTLILLPTLLVLIQNDTGSTLVYLSLFLVLFRAGFPPGLFIITLIVFFMSVIALLIDNVLNIFLFLMVFANLVLIRFWRKEERWTFFYIIVIIISWFFATKTYLTLLLAIHTIILFTFVILNLIRRNWQITLLTFVFYFISVIFMSSVNYLVNNILKSHQQERIWVWLRPEKCDPLGALYNLEQSKYAIGSGGFLGKGFLDGERTKLDYVPEQSTDFIFCTVGEEWGFIGSIIIIGLFITLLLRILYIAERQRNSFVKYYAYGVASIFLFHIFVNVGMTMGLLPVIGIPLPYISYGGSSMMSFSLMLSILIRLDSERTSTLRS
jgi:rod shape determining protein RodA